MDLLCLQQHRLIELGSIEVDTSPEAFGRLMDAERKRWQSLIQEIGVRAD